MAVQVLVGEVRGGVIWPDEPLTLPEGVRVTVVADLPEKGLVAVDPDDAELIRALHEADRGAAWWGRLGSRSPRQSS